MCVLRFIVCILVCVCYKWYLKHSRFGFAQCCSKLRFYVIYWDVIRTEIMDSVQWRLNIMCRRFVHK